MSDGLREHHREKLRRFFDGTADVCRVTIFGSRATGDWRTGSDLDIAIESSSGEAFELGRLVRLSRLISELNLPFEVDVVDRASISTPSLLAQITERGRVLWERSPTKLSKLARST